MSFILMLCYAYTTGCVEFVICKKLKFVITEPKILDLPFGHISMIYSHHDYGQMQVILNHHHMCK